MNLNVFNWEIYFNIWLGKTNMAAIGTQTQGDLRESNPLDFQQAMPELLRSARDFSWKLVQKRRSKRSTSWARVRPRSGFRDFFTDQALRTRTMNDVTGVTVMIYCIPGLVPVFRSISAFNISHSYYKPLYLQKCLKTMSMTLKFQGLLVPDCTLTVLIIRGRIKK